jgi:hypothetical protein
MFDKRLATARLELCFQVNTNRMVLRVLQVDNLIDRGEYSLARQQLREIKAELKATRAAERKAVKAEKRQIEAEISELKRQARDEKRKQKPRWQQKREAERDFRRVQLQMVPGSRAHAKYAKHRENQSAHLQCQLPKMQRHLPKRDRPRCGFPCGHPLRQKPCQAPVVAGRHPDTGAPILGKHCRKHGGWT